MPPWYHHIHTAFMGCFFPLTLTVHRQMYLLVPYRKYSKFQMITNLLTYENFGEVLETLQESCHIARLTEGTWSLWSLTVVTDFCRIISGCDFGVCLLPLSFRHAADNLLDTLLSINIGSVINMREFNHHQLHEPSSCALVNRTEEPSMPSDHNSLPEYAYKAIKSSVDLLFAYLNKGVFSALGSLESDFKDF